MRVAVITTTSYASLTRNRKLPGLLFCACSLNTTQTAEWGRETLEKHPGDVERYLSAKGVGLRLGTGL